MRHWSHFFQAGSSLPSSVEVDRVVEVLSELAIDSEMVFSWSCVVSLVSLPWSSL